ncbi:hypothetical protein LCGC14_1925630 [marine sediment metagenome]|uniref:M23ase beta-sheet core domain-containing protein n=1 Tax=marine sediment metagenome TaxID=412755 RepID=A0A0F9IMB1_9ZZZZ
MATSKDKHNIQVNQTGNAQAGLKGISGAFPGIGLAAIGVVGSIAALGAAFKSVVGAAAETEKQWNLVEASLERHGLAVDGNIGKVRGFADEMQTLTGVADEEYGRAVGKLVTSGLDLETSFEAVARAADVAAETGKNTAKIVTLMSDAIVKKDVIALEKWTGKIDASLPFAEKLNIALERMEKNFGGAAAANADSYTVKVAVMGQKFGDLQEKIGLLLLPTLTELASVGSTVIDTLMEVFDIEFPTDEAGEFRGELEGIEDAVVGIGDVIGPWVLITMGAFKTMSNAMQLLVLDPLAATREGFIGNGDNSGFGNSVLIQNTQTGETLRFSHLDGVKVRPGQKIGGGQQLGVSGNTGNSSGSHLDVEYRDSTGALRDVLGSRFKDLF